MMQVSKKIPFDDPQVLMGVRGLYLASNIIIIGIYLYLARMINSKKGTFEWRWLVVADDQNILLVWASANSRHNLYRYDHFEIRRTGPDGVGRGT